MSRGQRRYVQIRYWSQETQEFGRWALTQPMLKETADDLVARKLFPRAEIVEAT